MVKTIRKLACGGVFSSKVRESEAQKHSKGFISVYVLNIYNIFLNTIFGYKVTKINAYTQGVHANIYVLQSFRCRNLRSAKKGVNFYPRHVSIFTHEATPPDPLSEGEGSRKY